MRSLACLFLPLILAACQTTPDTSGPAAPDEQPEVTSASSTLPDGDACDLLTAEAIQRHLPVANGATIEASDLNDAIRYDDDARSCTWLWDGHRIGLHVAEKPDREDDWASGAVEARIADGYERTDVIGDASAFRADRSELFWHEGGRRTYLLSYGGPSPSARLEMEPLLELAAEIKR